MTVYCPNCGKPNTNEAQSCASCGTQLKKPKSSGGKFKGTMMMTSQAAPAAPAPAAAAPAPAAPPPAAPGVAPSPGGPVQAGAPKKKDMAFQATMLGPMTPPGAAPGAAPAGFGPPPAAAPPAAAPPAAAPAPAGFGAPPAAAPAPAGFGAPPAAAPAGFGAPAAAAAAAPAPAAGGFGAATPAPGGFGAAPAGAPAAGAPAAGGFGATGGGAPPAGGSPTPASGGGGGSKKKIIIGVGVGCLFFIMIACGVGAFLCNKAKNAAQEGMQNAGSDIGAEFNRISLGLTLRNIKMSCGSDPTGAGAAAYFHPQVFSQLQASACQIDDNAITAFGDGTRSEAHGVAGTDTESVATSLGGDLNKCFVYTSGSAKVAGCIFPDGFKLIALENPAGVQ